MHTIHKRATIEHIVSLEKKMNKNNQHIKITLTNKCNNNSQWIYLSESILH